jgi:hypothetical protein
MEVEGSQKGQAQNLHMPTMIQPKTQDTHTNNDLRYANLIHNTITSLNSCKGSSAIAIRKYIEKVYGPLGPNYRQEIGSTIRRMISNGELIRNGHNFQVFTPSPSCKNSTQKHKQKPMNPKKRKHQKKIHKPHNGKRKYKKRTKHCEGYSYKRKKRKESPKCESYSSSDYGDNSCHSKDKAKQNSMQTSNVSMSLQSQYSGSIRGSIPSTKKQSLDAFQ